MLSLYRIYLRISKTEPVIKFIEFFKKIFKSSSKTMLEYKKCYWILKWGGVGVEKSSSFTNLHKIILIFLDVLVYNGAMYLSFALRYQFNIPMFNYSAYLSSRPYIFVGFVILNILFGMYVFYNKQRSDFFYLTLIVQIFSTMLIMSLTFFGRWFTFPRSVILISLLVSTIVLYIWRAIVYHFYIHYNGNKRVMVVGSYQRCRDAIANIENSKNERYCVTIAAVDHFYQNILNHQDQVDIIYLADTIDHEEKIRIYEFCVRENKKMFLNTGFENLVLVNPNIMSIDDESIIEASKFEIVDENRFFKRMMDIIGSLMILIPASPIMVVTALLIKIDSKGPVFYRQTRITKGQREFDMLKFRSMSATAEKESGPVLAQANDSRVTRVGKYIRSLRIDELPQLLNVLKGDMSLVGPRPERPFFVDQFKKENPYYYLRHNVQAGITGYAQVYGKYASDYNAKLNFDLLYIKTYSLVFDVKILLQTIKILFDKVSSQGLEEEVSDQTKISDKVTVVD